MKLKVRKTLKYTIVVGMAIYIFILFYRIYHDVDISKTQIVINITIFSFDQISLYIFLISAIILFISALPFILKWIKQRKERKATCIRNGGVWKNNTCITKNEKKS